MTEKVSPRTKWFYGFGDIGFSLTNAILSVYFALFLTDVVGVKLSVAALAIFIGGTWDYINGKEIPMGGSIPYRRRQSRYLGPGSSHGCENL